MRRRTVWVGAGAMLAAAGLVVSAVLGFPTATASRGNARPVELPAEAGQLAFNMCAQAMPSSDPLSDGTDVQSIAFATTGSGRSFSLRLEAPGAWSVAVNRQRVSMWDADASRTAVLASNALPFAVSLYDCMSPYHFTQSIPQPPSSTSKLLQLYRYDRAVLWPCLTSHGIKMGDPPSRGQFVNSFTALTADPISAITPTPGMMPQLARALQDCPVQPPYLG